MSESQDIMRKAHLGDEIEAAVKEHPGKWLKLEGYIRFDGYGERGVIRTRLALIDPGDELSLSMRNFLDTDRP